MPETALQTIAPAMPCQAILNRAPAATIPVPTSGNDTSAGSNMVWTRMQLQRWNGASRDQSGEVLDAASD
jgi:hypothetical protein